MLLHIMEADSERERAKKSVRAVKYLKEEMDEIQC